MSESGLEKVGFRCLEGNGKGLFQRKVAGKVILIGFFYYSVVGDVVDVVVVVFTLS